MKSLTTIFSPILFLISLLWPKDKTLWLYGAWFGMDYRDNSKSIFEYALNKQSATIKIKNIWIYKNKALGFDLKQKNIPCQYAYSLKGFFLQLRAKVFITCVNSSDFIPFLITPKNIFVQLWHGSPMKKIGLDSRRKNSLRYFLDKIRFNTIDKYSVIISPAAVFDPLFIEAFQAKATVIKRAGYPRNDDLLTSLNEKIEVKQSLGIPKEDQLIIYMPTHRKEGTDKNFSALKSEILELQKYDEKLEQAGVSILVKPHFYEKKLLSSIQDSKKVKVAYNLPLNLYKVLGATDGLITDYSSVFFDYELINKPIFIYPFDLDHYLKNDRGMYFKFESLYPSLKNCTKVSSVGELIDRIINTNYTESQGEDPFIKSKFNEVEPLFSEKVYDLILEKISQS